MSKRNTPPRPGRPVRGSRSGRPLMAALDLFGQRWMLRVLWELRDGPLGFRELQQRCDAMSSSVLSDRLADLREAALIAKDADDRHALTAIGRDLAVAISPLSEWSARWAALTETV